MQLKDIDLNLLRLFDAVYRTGNVSRAAELLDLTQPAASQGLNRLRTLIHDPLFMRTAGGVQPSPKAQRLAGPVRQALATLEQAPGVRIETRPVPREQIPEALDAGRIDFAFGFLPGVKDTQQLRLLDDRYVVLLRAGHPFTRKRRSGATLLAALRELDFVAVRSHADTLRIVQQMQLQDRLRLVTEHFLVLPSIVMATDLAAIMPRNIARGFEGGYAIVEPAFPQRDFTVSLHWSRRFDADPGHRWLRALIADVFRQ